MLHNFPETMKSQRKAKGITMEELSAATMVSKKTLYSYEDGSRTPSLMVFLRLCAVLQINPQMFIR